MRQKMKTRAISNAALLCAAVAVMTWNAGTAEAQSLSAPGRVLTVPIGSGGVTIHWEMLQYPDLAGFVVEREEPALKVEKRREDRRHLDSYLDADTTYRYRVCAVYALSNKHEQACSDWVPARTGSAEPSPTRPQRAAPALFAHDIGTNHVAVRWAGEEFERFHIRWEMKRGEHPVFSGNEAQRAIDHEGREGIAVFDALRPSTAYLFKVQGCTLNVIGIANCGQWSDPVEVRTATPAPLAPVVTAVEVNARQIELTWPKVTTSVIETAVYRDGESLDFTYAETGAYRDAAVRPNTVRHTYRVCRRNEGGTACGEVTVRPRPVPPSRPVGFSAQKVGMVTGGDPRTGSAASMRVGSTIVAAQWSNGPADQYVPGRFLVVERLDAGTVAGGRDQLERVTEVWRELGRIDAAADPTRLNVAAATAPGYRPGNRYRVCAVVPELQAAGKVCSAPVVLR